MTAVLILSASSGSVQISAVISGKLEDASGGGVGGATVTVKSLETGAIGR
jgi:hypothetical protein